MSKYALIKDGFVVNMVLWDGSGDIFEDFETIEVTDDITVKIGDAVVDGKIYSKPGDNYEYVFDNGEWSLTEAGKKAKDAQELYSAAAMKESLLNTAKNAISIWQTELILGIISDEDKASLTAWIAYIKKLQAVDTSSLPVSWPTSPQ